jgi:WD40 repeat protein
MRCPKAARSLALALGVLSLLGPAAPGQTVHRVAKWSVPPLKANHPILDAIGFSPDGKTLGVVASLEGPRWFIAYDTATRKETLRFQFERRPVHVRGFLYTLDGKSLVVRMMRFINEDAKDPLDRFVWLIDVRDAKTGKLRHTIRLPARQACSVHATPDSKTLVCWGPGNVQLIDLESGRGTDRFAAADGNAHTQTALSADGKLLAVLSADGKLGVYDLRKGKRVCSADPPEDAINGPSPPAFTPDGKAISYVTDGDDLYTYDSGTGKQLSHKKKVYGARAKALGYAGSDTLVMAGIDYRAGVGLYSFRRDRNVQAPHVEINRFSPEFATISADGTRAAIARYNGEIRLFEIDPKKDAKDD